MTMHTQRSSWRRLAIGGLLATLGAAPFTRLAADGNDPLVSAAQQLLEGVEARGAWRNPWMPPGTGQEATHSGDELLAAIVRSHHREFLDRGGWINPYVPAPGYDVGNALLAVVPGDGVTSGS